MAMAGAKPKPDGEKVTRTKPVHDWIEVLDVPYTGKRPPLPKGLPRETLSWWRVVSRMPHCILWTSDDWQFAIDTAQVHARFVEGRSGAAAELRLRGAELGITWWARRDLRIRYVEAKDVVAEEPIDSSMADFDAERRRRLLDAS